MIYLSLSIFSSVFITLIFKSIERFKLDLLLVIVVNYITAFILGNLINSQRFSFTHIIYSNWIFYAIFIGFLLIFSFFLIGFSIQKIGISKTTISNKMSVVLPIIFSIIYYHENITIIKISGIVLALTSILLATYRKKEEIPDKKFIFLPFLLFLGVGSIDTSLKYCQQEFLNDENLSLFTAVSFGIAGIIGIIFSIFRNKKMFVKQNLKAFPFGIILGLVNFGSMYFLILALESGKFDSSVVYGINNVSIIVVSIFAAFILFKEKISKINLLGIFIAILSILIIAGFVA